MLASSLWFRFLYSANVSRDVGGEGGQGYLSNHKAAQPRHQNVASAGEITYYIELDICLWF